MKKNLTFLVQMQAKHQAVIKDVLMFIRDVLMWFFKENNKT